jgi:hypothetical protein
MAAQVAARARHTIALLFTIFLLINVVVLTMAALSVATGNLLLLPPHLGADTATGARLALLLVGGAAAWFFARMVFQLLVNAEVGVEDAVGPSFSLLSYLILIVAAVTFLGSGSWLWLPVFFLIVLVWSVVTIWGLVGGAVTIAGLAVALLGAIVTWYMLG